MRSEISKQIRNEVEATGKRKQRVINAQVETFLEAMILRKGRVEADDHRRSAANERGTKNEEGMCIVPSMSYILQMFIA